MVRRSVEHDAGRRVPAHLLRLAQLRGPRGHQRKDVRGTRGRHLELWRHSLYYSFPLPICLTVLCLGLLFLYHSALNTYAQYVRSRSIVHRRTALRHAALRRRPRAHSLPQDQVGRLPDTGLPLAGRRQPAHATAARRPAQEGHD